MRPGPEALPLDTHDRPDHVHLTSQSLPLQLLLISDEERDVSSKAL